MEILAVSTILLRLNQNSEQISECMPTLDFLHAVNKTADILLDSLNPMQKCIQDVQLELFETCARKWSR